MLMHHKWKYAEKERLCEEMAREWSMGNANELVFGLRDFNGYVGKCAQGFEDKKEEIKSLKSIVCDTVLVKKEK